MYIIWLTKSEIYTLNTKICTYITVKNKLTYIFISKTDISLSKANKIKYNYNIIYYTSGYYIMYIIKYKN